MTENLLDRVHGAVLEGKVDEAAQGVQEAVGAGIPAKEILDKGLIPAMNLVGEKFGDGEMFIPQVLWSAKAMQGGMDILKPLFEADDRPDWGKVVIGTARGDIHDIGKNLVAIMLEGAGFEVVDLGVDVAAERFVDVAVEKKADVIAISALLTTTMQSMADVVALLRERDLPGIKVVIGGAPVDMDFCRRIGAQAYGMDAMDGVRKVKELVSGC